MNKIGDISIVNDQTFQNLKNVFNNKNPTNKTILLLRLYAEKNISVTELEILSSEDVKNDKKGYELLKQQNAPIVVFERIKALDISTNRDPLITKIKMI